MQVTYFIKDEREKQNLSIRDLAEKSGVSKSSISNFENGKHHPTVYSLCEIAAALNKLPCDLFDYM